MRNLIFLCQNIKKSKKPQKSTLTEKMPVGIDFNMKIRTGDGENLDFVEKKVIFAGVYGVIGNPCYRSYCSPHLDGENSTKIRGGGGVCKESIFSHF